jgi:redox-sensitive bicupin YhaK (pirin superfamily)
MFKHLRNSQRGSADHGWLQSNHSFSFASYYNPKEMGFGPLRVINEDRVQPASGFGQHGHENMEIISYVISGALEHKDSLGTGSVIHYGDVQRMSAGNGVTHSEFNHSSQERVHFLQIWIKPNVLDIEPSYEEKHFDPASKTNQLRLIASADARQGSLLIHQDADLYASILNVRDEVKYALSADRTAYLHVINGKLNVNGEHLNTGDALKINNEHELHIKADEHTEFLLFDLPC